MKYKVNKFQLLALISGLNLAQFSGLSASPALGRGAGTEFASTTALWHAGFNASLSVLHHRPMASLFSKSAAAPLPHGASSPFHWMVGVEKKEGNGRPSISGLVGFFIRSSPLDASLHYQSMLPIQSMVLHSSETGLIKGNKAVELKLHVKLHPGLPVVSLLPFAVLEPRSSRLGFNWNFNLFSCGNLRIGVQWPTQASPIQLLGTLYGTLSLRSGGDPLPALLATESLSSQMQPSPDQATGGTIRPSAQATAPQGEGDDLPQPVYGLEGQPYTAQVRQSAEEAYQASCHRASNELRSWSHPSGRRAAELGGLIDWAMRAYAESLGQLQTYYQRLQRMSRTALLDQERGEAFHASLRTARLALRNYQAYARYLDDYCHDHHPNALPLEPRSFFELFRPSAPLASNREMRHIPYVGSAYTGTYEHYQEDYYFYYGDMGNHPHNEVVHQPSPLSGHTTEEAARGLPLTTTSVVPTARSPLPRNDRENLNHSIETFRLFHRSPALPLWKEGPLPVHSYEERFLNHLISIFREDVWSFTLFPSEVKVSYPIKILDEQNRDPASVIVTICKAQTDIINAFLCHTDGPIFGGVFSDEAALPPSAATDPLLLEHTLDWYNALFGIKQIQNFNGYKFLIHRICPEIKIGAISGHFSLTIDPWRGSECRNP